MNAILVAEWSKTLVQIKEVNLSYFEALKKQLQFYSYFQIC